MSAAPKRILDLSPSQLDATLAGPGLFVDYGACVVRVHAQLPGFGSTFRKVYRWFHSDTPQVFADFHVELASGQGIRRWVRSQARFRIDGVEPFEPFSLTSALPLLEWGVNWCFAQRFNQYVLLHAGVLAIGSRAVIMAATPGSGKSTLSAAMMLSGFRLLSDEFGVLDPESGSLLPMLKPVALKNRSIDVIRDFSEHAILGPTFPGTRKGDVAHLAPDEHSVSASCETAAPTLVIFPSYREGATLSIVPQPKEQAFARLAFNSFNYGLLGPLAFNAVADIAERTPAYQLTYGSLADAIACLRDLVRSKEAAPLEHAR
jgi:HprK-related kinase A